MGLDLVCKEKIKKIENRKCKKWYSHTDKYCLRQNCTSTTCSKRHIRSLDDLLRRPRTQLCTDDCCKGGNCKKAHTPEGVRKTFVTMCLEKILSINSELYPLNWKSFFPKRGQFNTTLDFFSYVHKTVAEWTIDHRESLIRSQPHVIKDIGSDEEIWKKENFSKNITRWVYLAYDNGKLKPEFKLWSGEDGDQYREDIIRLLGARIETEGHHLRVCGEDMVSVHKSWGCAGDQDEHGNYRPCPYFCNCFKGFHTLREYMQEVPIKTFCHFQIDCNSPEKFEGKNNVILGINGSEFPSAFLKKDDKYILVCKVSGHVVVRLKEYTEEEKGICKDYQCSFLIEPGPKGQRLFQIGDLTETPEIIAFDTLVEAPILTLSYRDLTHSRSMLTLDTGTSNHLQEGCRYLLRFFVMDSVDDKKPLFYDELTAIFSVKMKKQTGQKIHMFILKEGFLPGNYSFLEVFRSFNIGSVAEKSSYGTLLPIIEKNFVETSYVFGCSDESDKLKILRDRNGVYQKIKEAIRDYNKTLQDWHKSEGFNQDSLYDKWKVAIENFMGNPLFNFKPLEGIKNTKSEEHVYNPDDFPVLPVLVSDDFKTPYEKDNLKPAPETVDFRANDSTSYSSVSHSNKLSDKPTSILKRR